MASWKSEKKEKNWDFILAKRDNKSNKNFIKPLFLELDDYRSTVKFQWCHRHSEKMSIQAFCFFFLWCQKRFSSVYLKWYKSLAKSFNLLWFFIALKLEGQQRYLKIFASLPQKQNHQLIERRHQLILCNESNFSLSWDHIDNGR
jgi:hypothetical protein